MIRPKINVKVKYKVPNTMNSCTADTINRISKSTLTTKLEIPNVDVSSEDLDESVSSCSNSNHFADNLVDDGDYTNPLNFI